MKILSVNIRATQGGAGRVGLDLHRRLARRGEDSQLLYGYGSGIKPDRLVVGDPSITMIGSRSTVLLNYASHWICGHEISTSSRAELRAGLDWADVLHIHAAHHWYLSWNELIRMIRAAKIPTIMTAHDWWLVTGRCGFVRQCTGWQRQCGECGSMRFQDLPSLFDRSKVVRANRQAALRTIREQLTIVCPSKHLQRDHKLVYPDFDVRFVPNALDTEFENIVRNVTNSEDRSGYVFCASDLSSPGKIDADLVAQMSKFFGKDVGLIGRNNSFGDIGVTDFGEVRNREGLASIFRRSRALLFTSTMDNAPLTIIEALSAGCFVIAYASPAAAEMLELVGARCVSSANEAFIIASEGREAELYGGMSHAELGQKAREIWSGEAMVSAYMDTYCNAIRLRSGRSL